MKYQSLSFNMSPHSVPPSSPPGAEKSTDVDMEDGAAEAQSHVSVPHGIQINGNGNGNSQNEDSDQDSKSGEKKNTSKSNVNLEELFDAEDSDEEFSSSAAVRGLNGEDEDERDGERNESKGSLLVSLSLRYLCLIVSD